MSENPQEPERIKSLHVAASAFRRAWNAWPAGCVLLLAVNGVTAAVPAASAYTFGRLVGVMQAGIASGRPDSGVEFWLVCALSVILVSVICRIAAGHISAALGRQLDFEISREVLLHAATLDQEYFESPDCQDQLARARNQPGNICFRFVTGSIQAATGVIQALSILVVLFWINSRCGLLLSALVIPTFLIHWYLTRLRYGAEQNKTSKRRWSAYYLKTCTAHAKTPTLKVFGLQPLIAERFATCMKELNDIDADVARKQSGAYLAESIIVAVGLLTAAGWIAGQTVRGELSMESFVTFWIAAAQFRSCLPAVQGSAATALQMLMHLGDLSRFFAERPRIPPEVGRRPCRPRGEIRLQNVTFSYRGAAGPAVQGVDLTVFGGETIGIVGPNGAGKTTLAKLMLRLYVPTDGVIQVDGHNLNSLHLAAYHRHTAYVGHYPLDLETTAAESIAFGDWENLLENSGRVREIAASLGLTSMLERLPDGFETRLGCRFGDCDLSAGQWQKIAIARALARNPAILIMDEPTANLDARYEFELLSALKHLADGRTTIIISHRLSTLQMADRIVVMKDGRIVDQGRHDELIGRDGTYAQLYRAQAPAAA